MRYQARRAETLNRPTCIDCDLLVVGSGAAGLSAAVTAAWHGLKVIVCEKDATFGGTTALSGGWIWAPGNPLAPRSGIVESRDAPRTYLQHVLGNHFREHLVDAFLDSAPEMVDFFDTHTALQFELGSHIPDTYGNLPGAGTGGRSVIAAPFNGRALGRHVELLARPLRETTFLGLTIQAGPDLKAFMNVTRSPRAFAYVAGRMGRHLLDLVLHGRGMQLRNGLALVGRLLRSAIDLGVELRPSSPVRQLLFEGDTVRGAILDSPTGDIEIRAASGVVLGTGGFAHDDNIRLERCGDSTPRFSVAGKSSTGDGLRLGEAVGAQLNGSMASADALCPVSLVPHADGTVGRFPHIIERGKPGLIGVMANGRRFCNEGDGYHDYVCAMLDNVPAGEEIASWLICTHAFQRRYGLGYARPAPLPIGAHVRSGYLVTADTLAELAIRCGIDPEGLERTVTDYNRHAREGLDPEFGRGSTAYNRLQGDPDQLPNPCVAPIENGPFHAVKVLPGSFANFAGLNTDGDARALDADGKPIPNLYVAGTDMASVMGGHYPAGGINLGPALTFGFRAACHAVSWKVPPNQATEVAMSGASEYSAGQEAGAR